MKCFNEVISYYDKVFPNNIVTAPLRFLSQEDQENENPNT